MDVTLIYPGDTTHCVSGQATLSWSVDGASATVVQVEILQAAAPFAAAPAVVSVGAGRLLLAALPAAVVVAVRPERGETFGDGTVVTGDLTLRVADQDVEQFVLPRVDVSGCGSVVLLELVPLQSNWRLSIPHHLVQLDEEPEVRAAALPTPSSAAEAHDTVGARFDHPHGLYQRAAYEARRQSEEADGRSVASRALLHLAIDASASFQALARDGAAQTLLEVVLGVNSVIGRLPAIEVWTLGPHPVRLPVALERSTLDGFWADRVGATARSGGVPIEPLLDRSGSMTPGSTIIVLTDGAPPDLCRLKGLLSARETTGIRVHLLVLGRGPGDARVQRDPWRDELIDLQPLVAAELLTFTAISPEEAAAELPGHLDPSALATLVGSLVDGLQRLPTLPARQGAAC